MKRPLAFDARQFQSISHGSPRAYVLPLCGLLATITVAVLSLVAFLRLPDPDSLLAYLAVGCGLLTFVQARQLANVARGKAMLPVTSRGEFLAFAERMCWGVLMVYLACLAWGARPQIEFAFATGILAWYTLVVLWFAAPSPVVEQWRHWTQTRIARRLRIATAAIVALLLFAESGLQARRYMAENQPLAPAVRTIDATNLLSNQVAVTEIDDAMLPSRHRRVAVLSDGGQTAADGADYLDLIQKSLPGTRIVPVPLTTNWIDEPSQSLIERAVAAKADLLLIVLAPCDELARWRPEPSWFDWRQLELARLAVADQNSRTTIAPRRPDTMATYEQYLDSLSGQLLACRTPMPATTRRQWTRTLNALDDLVEACSLRTLPVAIVVAPGVLQVHPTLFEQVARRNGLSQNQLDQALPQRMLASFAQQRQVQCIDLLPGLRMCRPAAYERNSIAWNEHGHAAVAGAISGWLESRFGHQVSAAAQLADGH